MIDKSTYVEPFADNEGIECVIVNGALVLEKGKHTGGDAGTGGAKVVRTCVASIR